MQNPTAAVLYLFFFVLFLLSLAGAWLGILHETAFLVIFMVCFFGPIVAYLLGDLIDIPFERRRFAAGERQRIQVYSNALPLAQASIGQLVEKHEVALKRNIMKASQPDDYGRVDVSKKKEVVRRFLDETGFDFKEFGPRMVFELDDENLLVIVEDKLADLAKRRVDTDFDPCALPENGHEFEHWVADALRSFGWETRVTQGSGDQGIDVLATYGDVSIGIQCKLYTGSIGNKAVQEAYAGRIFYQSDHAAVLSSATYTRSARDLAASTGIFLLSPYDIPTLRKRLEEMPSIDIVDAAKGSPNGGAAG